MNVCTKNKENRCLCRNVGPPIVALAMQKRIAVVRHFGRYFAKGAINVPYKNIDPLTFTFFNSSIPRKTNLIVYLRLCPIITTQMKDLYIVRHGETDYNKKGIVQGSGVDSHLNVRGLKQSQAFYDQYKQIDFDVLYVSPLKRAQESIMLFQDKQAWQVVDGLREIGWGHHEGKRPSKKMKREFDHMLAAWQAGQTYVKVEGGESPDDVIARLTPFVEILKASNEQKILICSHGRTIKLLLTVLHQIPASEMDQFGVNNLSVHHLKWDGVQKTEAVLENCTKHWSSPSVIL